MSDYSGEHILKQNKINKEVSLKLSKLDSCYKQNKAILNQTLKNDNRITNLEKNLKRVMDKMDILNVSYEQVKFENDSILKFENYLILKFNFTFFFKGICYD